MRLLWPLRPDQLRVELSLGILSEDLPFPAIITIRVSARHERIPRDEVLVHSLLHGLDRPRSKMIVRDVLVPNHLTVPRIVGNCPVQRVHLSLLAFVHRRRVEPLAQRLRVGVRNAPRLEHDLELDGNPEGLGNREQEGVLALEPSRELEGVLAAVPAHFVARDGRRGTRARVRPRGVLPPEGRLWIRGVGRGWNGRGLAWCRV